MNNSDKHPLQLLLENTDYADRMRSYEGRGMYGKPCLGVTASSIGDLFADVLSAAAEWTQDEPDGDRDIGEASEVFRRMRTDNMGHDVIVYFPGVSYLDDEEDEEKDDALGRNQDDECDD